MRKRWRTASPPGWMRSPPSLSPPPVCAAPSRRGWTPRPRFGAASRPGIMPRISELKEELGEEAVQEILAAFIEDIGANLKTIQEAAARSDTRAVYRLAHVITGAARNV